MAGNGLGSRMAVWSGPTPLPMGFWVPWDALVSNVPGIGDFTTISAACAALPAGRIIMVDCTGIPYTEVANIVMKEGQIVMAFDGDGRLTGPVTVNMYNGVANFAISVPANNCAIQGLTFDWSGVTGAFAGTDIMAVAGSNFRCENSVFYYGGGAPINAHGIFLSGSNAYFRNVTVNGSPRMVNPLNCTGSANLFYSCVFFGGDGGGAGPGSVIAGSSNMFLDTAFTSDGLNSVTGNLNNFIRCFFGEGSALVASLSNIGSENAFTDCTFSTGFGGNSLIANGPIQRYTRCRMSSGGGTSVSVGAVADSIFTDCSAVGRFTVANLATNINITGQVFDPGGGPLVIAGQTVRLIDCKIPDLTLSATATDVWEFGCTITVLTDTAKRLQRGMAVHLDTVDPTVNDDLADGYLIGLSYWLNTTPPAKFLRCDSNAAGAAVWTVVGGAPVGLYSKLIHPVAGVGDYQTISKFCTDEPAGTIAGICPGTYTETANIAMKAGQQVFGIGGIDNTAARSVFYNMGNFTLTNEAKTALRGIWFNFAVTADSSKVNLTGATDWVVDNCVFDYTPTVGATVHRGVSVSGTGFRFERVQIIGHANTYRLLYSNTSKDSLFRTVKISGGGTTAGNINYVHEQDSARNTWDDIRITPSTMVATGNAWRTESTLVNSDPNTYSNIKLYFTANGAGAGTAWFITSTAAVTRTPNNMISNLQIRNFYTGVSISYMNGICITNSVLGDSANPVGNNSLLTANSASLLRVENSTMYANGVAAALSINGSGYFSNCFFGGSAPVGLTASFCTGSAFVNCYADGATFLSCQDMSISNCNFSSNVTITTCNRVRITGSAFYGFNLTLNTTNNAQISGCNFLTALIINAGCTGTQISGCTIPTFTDGGDDTVRDVYTQETIAGNIAVRGSRDYNNRGAGGPFTLTLPNPAAVTVSVGYRFRVVVLAAQNMVITGAALQVLYGNGFSSSVAGTVTSNTPYSVIEFEYKGANEWVAVAALGAWVFA